MVLNILQNMKKFSQSKWYWLFCIGAGLALLIVALLYQHYFDELPCVLCIQVRLWLSVLVIIACVGLFSQRASILNLSAHTVSVLVSIALLERSYQLLGTERGFVFGDCGFSLGMPPWFAIEDWLPWLYRVETSCGYTPEIIFGITMAEALMVFSTGLLLLSVTVLVFNFKDLFRK